MESSSTPLTPGKNGKPCPSCSPVKYEGVMTYVCSSPVVVVQRVSPKACRSSQRRIDLECTSQDTKEDPEIYEDLQNKPKKSSRRGRPKFALKKSAKGKRMPLKSSSLSRTRDILNAVDLNESDDFKSLVTTGPNKRRKLSDTEKEKCEITRSNAAFSEVSRSKTACTGRAGSGLTSSREGMSQIRSSDPAAASEVTGSKKASSHRENSDQPISKKEWSQNGSSEKESSLVPVAGLDIDMGASALTVNQVCGTESEKVTTESEPWLGNSGEYTDEMKSCVICRQSVKSENLQSHQKACLNRHFTRGANPAGGTVAVSDEALARTLQQTELLESSPPLELVLCQICSLDLSGLSTHRQTQHVNSCMDKKEAATAVAVADAEALERARKAVLDCPMCGKPLKTDASRKSHLNRCSKSCNVGPDQLYQLVEQQRREYEARLAAGQIPLTTRAQKSRNKGQSAKTKKTTKVIDEDTQVALALSTSIVEEQQRQETQLLDQLESVDRLALGCKKSDKDIKKGRRKKGNPQIGEELPVLLKYTTDEIRRKIAERVAMFVSTGDMDQIDNTPPMSESIVLKRFPNKTDRQSAISNTERTNGSLWKKSSLNSDTYTEMYYVKELSPLVKVCTGQFDRLLAKMSAQNTGSANVVDNSGNQKVADTEIGDEASSMDFASTQTAVVLAELAAEDDSSVLPSSPNCSSQNLTHINNSQNIADRDCKGQMPTSLVKSFAHAISKSAPERDVCLLDKGKGACVPEVQSSGVEDVVNQGPDNCADGSEHNIFEEPEEEATSSAENCGDIKAAAQEGYSKGDKRGREFFNSKKMCSPLDASGFCFEDQNKVDPVVIAQGLQSQLSFLVNNPLFSDVKLFTGDQKVVHAHRVILAARCPQLIQDLQQTSEDLHLEDFSSKAVLNVIKFIYAGEILMIGNCEEEILLAERFGVEELCEILKESVGDRWDPNADAGDDKTVEKEQVLDDLVNSLFDGSMETVVQETSGEILEEQKDEEEMDSLYQFMSTQREKSSANKRDNSNKGEFKCNLYKIPHSGDQWKDINAGNSEQPVNQASHPRSTEKGICKNKAVEHSVTVNDCNKIEENRRRCSKLESNTENDIGRGLKRVTAAHCDQDRGLETDCKRIKLDEPSSDRKSDPELSSPVELAESSKSPSAVDLCHNDENHFDIVHSMLNELSPGESENYQPDWFKSSLSGSSNHTDSEKDRTDDQSKDSEDMEHQHDMDFRENSCGDTTACNDLSEEERKSGEELIMIDVDPTEDTSKAVHSKCNDGLVSNSPHLGQDCSIDSYSPLKMSVDCNITPEMVSFDDNSHIMFGSESIHAKGQMSKLNCSAGQRSESTTALIEDVNSSNDSLAEVAKSAEAETSKSNKDIESLHPTDVDECDERQDATAGDSDSWLIPDTPVKLPSLSGRSVLNEDRSKTFGSKSRNYPKRCPSPGERDTNGTLNRRKFKLKNKLLIDSKGNLTPESFSPKSSSVLENSGICDLSKFQPSFSTAVVSTPVLQRAVNSFTSHISVSNLDLKKKLDLKDSVEEIISVSKTIVPVMNTKDNLEITAISTSYGVSGNKNAGTPGKQNDILSWQKSSEACTLSEPGSPKTSSDEELTPDQRKELLIDVDNFFARSPSERRKDSVISKLKILSPRTGDVSVSREVSIHIESDGDEELPEVSENQGSALRKSPRLENVDGIDLDPDTVEKDVGDKPNNACSDIKISSGNAVNKHQQGKKYTFKKLKLINSKPISCFLEKLPDIASPKPTELLMDQSQVGKPTVAFHSVSRVSSPSPLIDCPAGEPESPAHQCETSPSQANSEGQREESTHIKGPSNSDHAMSQGDTICRDPDSPVECPEVDVWEDFDDAGVEFNPGACHSFVDYVDKDHSVQNISLAKAEDRNSQMSGTAPSPVKDPDPEPIVVGSSPELRLSAGDMAQPLPPLPTPPGSLTGTPPDLGTPPPQVDYLDQFEELHSPPPQVDYLDQFEELHSPPPQVDYLDQFEELQEHQQEWEPTSPPGPCSPVQNCETRPPQPAEVNFSKTPTCTPRVSKKPKKKWVPPSPFTPMPDYDRMNTPGLKKEMQKFGIKPVSKKRMIVCLKDIYQQTHQYETDSEAEVSIVEVEADATAMDTQKEEVMKERKDAKCKLKGGRVTSNGHKSKPRAMGGGTKVSQKGDAGKSAATKLSQKGAASKSAATKELIDLSQEEDDSEPEEESCGSDMVEESFFMESEMLSSQQESSPNLHEELHKFFTSNPELYTRVLMYEPLEFDWLREEIKKAGIKCSMPKLIHFMDERCITFTMKSRRADKPRGRRKKAVKKTTESAVS